MGSNPSGRVRTLPEGFEGFQKGSNPSRRDSQDAGFAQRLPAPRSDPSLPPNRPPSLRACEEIAGTNVGLHPRMKTPHAKTRRREERSEEIVKNLPSVLGVFGVLACNFASQERMRRSRSTAFFAPSRLRVRPVSESTVRRAVASSDNLRRHDLTLRSRPTAHL